VAGLLTEPRRASFAVAGLLTKPRRARSETGPSPQIIERILASGFSE